VKKLKTKQEIYEHLKELKWIVKNMDYPPNEMTQEDYNIICAEIEVLEWILGDIYWSQNAQNVNQINLLQEQVNLLMIQKTKYIFVLV